MGEDVRSFREVATAPVFGVCVGASVVALVAAAMYMRANFGKFGAVVSSSGRTPRNYFFGNHLPRKALIPTMVVYWCCVLVVPPSLGTTSCSGGMRWESHVIFAVHIVTQILLDASMSAALSTHSDAKNEYISFPASPCLFWRGFSHNTAAHLLAGVFAKMDTYTDMCFVVIARRCASPLWVPSACIFAVAIMFCQILPSIAGFFRGQAVGAPAQRAQLLDFHLTGAVLKRRGVNMFGREAYKCFFMPLLLRFVLEDVPQAIIQTQFVLERRHAGEPIDALVLCSLALSVVASCLGAWKAIHMVWCKRYDALNGYGEDVGDAGECFRRVNGTHACCCTCARAELAADKHSHEDGAKGMRHSHSDSISDTVVVVHLKDTT